MKNIKNIIFDFGGVLYDIDFNQTKKALKELSENPEQIQNFDSKNFADFPALFETGKISADEFLEKMRTTFKLNAENLHIIDAWNKLLLKPFDDAPYVLENLSGKYNLYLLSNTNEIHFEYFYPQSKEIFNKFRKVFLSYEIGLRKPDTSIFKYVINNLKINPADTLFIDDNRINIETAKITGFKTIHFVNQKLSDLLHTI